MIPRSVCILIRSLGPGGAETQAVSLAINLTRAGDRVRVIAMYEHPQSFLLTRVLEEAGVRHQVVGKRGRWDVAAFAWRLWTSLRADWPDTIVSYMTAANLASLIGRLGRPRLRILWGIRATLSTLPNLSLATRAFLWIERLSCSLSDHIVCNSASGADDFKRWAVNPPGISVIPNAIDSAKFRFSAVDRVEFRARQALPEGAFVVGIVGRIDPVKDHETFLRGFCSALEVAGNDLRAIVIGSGDAQLESNLKDLCKAIGIDQHVGWLGHLDEVRKGYSGMDLLVVSSVSEGWPNVIGEALACELPCISTNVGDAKHIVGEDCVVPPKQPDLLAQAILAHYSRGARREPALREKVTRMYSETAAIDAYRRLI